MANTVTVMEMDYADTLEAQLIAEYVSGGETLVDACRVLGVPMSTTYDRIKRSPRFAEMMNLARDCGYDVIASNLRQVVRGVEGFSSGDVKRDRLIAETDTKLLAKWHPHKYGEKLQIESKSANVAIPVGNDPVVAQRAYEELLKGS